MAINALARSAGIPPSTVKNILNGASKNPGVVTIKMICDGFGISLTEFFDTDVTDPGRTKELLDAANKLDNEHLDHLIAIAKGLR